jgi:hypothetical protein
LRPPKSLRSGPALLATAVAALFLFSCFAHSSPGQPPRLVITGNTSAFAFGPGDLIVYAVRQLAHSKQYDIEHDDVWLATLEGKKSRIFDGPKSFSELAPQSYAIRSFSWAPSGRSFIIEMDRIEVKGSEGDTLEGQAAALMDTSGKAIEIAGTHSSVIAGAYHAAWLGDGATVAYVTRAQENRSLLQISTVRPLSRPSAIILTDTLFMDVAWDTPRNSAMAIARTLSPSSVPNLVQIDLVKPAMREIAAIDGYESSLIISHSGDRVAWFRDPGTLEIRRLSSPAKPILIEASAGHCVWSADDRYILLQSAASGRSSPINWIDPATGKFDSVLNSLIFAGFEVSPDGRYLGVFNPGHVGFQIYPMPAPEFF